MNFKRFFIILPIVVLTGCTTVREARKVQRGEDSPIGERMPTAAELGLTSDKAATLADLEEVQRGNAIDLFDRELGILHVFAFVLEFLARGFEFLINAMILT